MQMTEPTFTIKEVTSTGDYGEFVIEPLEPGYGHTMGNALRRVMYASIPGAAVTSVKIAGVKHKFSTLPGLKENIVDFLLQIKDLTVRLSPQKESATIKISVKGPKEITAGDIEVSDGVEVVNPAQYLGSLSAKGKLDMELTVEPGFGYSLAEERRIGTVGVIPTDAVFTPVKRVTYSVEATRVGRQTNLDKLILKVWTNGSVTPREVLETASKMLSSYFRKVYEPNAQAVEENNVTASSSIPESTLKLTIDELDLPTRIYNSLRNGGIETVEQLLQMPRRELISMRNMGGKSITVIEDKLREKGIALGA